MTDHGRARCQYLEWDSSFFGCRIGQANLLHLLPEDIGTMLQWCAMNRIDCLYLLLASDDAGAVRAAEEHAFRFVDIRMTFECTTEPASTEGAGLVRLASAEDIADLKQIARSSFRDSRFYYDAGFENSRCDDLYATWIERSCSGFADFVLVAEDNGRPAGWVTGHLGPEEIGRIGLIAVNGPSEGRGWGRLLVTSALRTFRERGMRAATVVTQGRNVRSQRLYQKCGFVTRSVELWYHRWFV